jgi:hypothetical protein
MADEVKKGSVEENKADEIPKPASIKISPARISVDGKKIYFDVSMGEEKIGEIWISKDRKERNGEEITTVRAKIIPGPAFKDLTEETKPAECLIKKDEDLSERVGKCFEKMGEVFEGIAGKNIYIEGKVVRGGEALTMFINKAVVNWDRYLDDLKEMMRERARKAGGRKSRKRIYIVERALARIYKKDPGAVWLAISYYAASKKFDPITVGKILKDLYDQVGDSGSIVDRAAILIKAYRDAGVDLSQYREELEKILETSLDEIERRAGEIKITVEDPRKTLIDVVERALGVERSRRVLRIIAGFFGDFIAKKTRENKRLREYAAADLLQWRTLIIKIIRDKAGEVIDVDQIEVLSGAPEEIDVIKSRFSNTYKYRIVWRNPALGDEITYGPDLLDMVVNRIIADGHAVRKDQARDVLNNVVQAFIERGLAKKVKEEIKGFVLDKETRSVKVNMIDIKEPSLEELERAVEFIDVLHKWCSESKNRVNALGVMLKWAAAAPFGWVYKEMRQGERLWVPAPCGKSHSGKTTLSHIALAVWGRGREHIVNYRAVDNAYRMGMRFSESTLPWAINEADTLVRDDKEMSVLIDAIMGEIYRSKQHTIGVFVNIPALSLPIFVLQSCEEVRKREAYMRRLRILEFTEEDEIPEELAREFEKEVLKNIGVLEAVGRFAGSYVIKSGLKLDLVDFDDLGLKIFEEIYRTLGKILPDWIRDAEPPSIKEIYAESKIDVEGIFRDFLIKKIEEAYYKGHSRELTRIVEIEDSSTGNVVGSYRETDTVGVDKMLDEVLQDRLISWLIKRGNEVIITSAVRFERDFPEKIKEHGGLKGLAKILGWDYGEVKIGGKNVKAITVKMDKLIDFLLPLAEKRDESQGQRGAQP